MSALASRLETLLGDAVERGVAPGAVAAVAHGDAPDVIVTAGALATIADDGGPVPEAERAPVAADALYDLASITKVFTAITILSLVDDGVLDVTVPVGEWLPSYREGEKSAVTLAHLLSHTSGLPASWFGWHDLVRDEGTDRARWTRGRRSEQLDRILELDLARSPGTGLEYSCLGYITSMAIAERATREFWPTLVSDRVLTPLGLRNTVFTPPLERTAPTEYEPQLGRGMVHGIVHDETANALNGASANAGLFGTAGDLLTLGRAVLAGLPGILSPSSFDLAWNNQLPMVVGDRADEVQREEGFGQALGFRIGQVSWMGRAADEARGHNGYTGTSLTIDRRENRVVALLTNRVHPSRNGPEVSPLRAAVGEAAYGL
jgi:CubicO group peptidase (beta-lactamase class C family)